MNKKIEWQPKGGEYLCHHTGFIVGPSGNDFASEFNGCTYKTLKLAEKAAKAMRAHNRLLAYVAEFAPDWEPDWGNERQLKAEVMFNSLHGEWVIENWVYCSSPSVVYMPEHVAKELCDKLNSGEVVL